MHQLERLTEYKMVVSFIDMERSTEIATVLGERHWVNFLSEFYQVVENRVVIYTQHGCCRHKFIGDAALLIFHPQFAMQDLDDPELVQMVNYAFEFVQDVNDDLQKWISLSRERRTQAPWSRQLDQQVLHGYPIRIVASLAVGSIILFNEPDRPDRIGQRHEIAGLTVHLASRLMETHKLLPKNNVFITAQCYERLLSISKEFFLNITDFLPKGFSTEERVYSGQTNKW